MNRFVSANHGELYFLSRQLQAVAKGVAHWLSYNDMGATLAKLQALLLKGNKQGNDFKVKKSNFRTRLPRLASALRKV